MSDLANVISSARIILDDTATSKFNLREDLSKQIAGTNKLFYLDNRPTIATIEAVVSDGVVLALTSGYTINAATGLITIVGTAPAASLYVTYYWQDFTDANIQDFIYRGLAEIGSSSGQGNENTDLANVVEPLKKAVLEYACHLGFQALAAKTARLFAAGAGKKNIDKKQIYTNYINGAKEYWDKAELTKNNYYKKQGRQFNPAASVFPVTYPTNTPRR